MPTAPATFKPPQIQGAKEFGYEQGRRATDASLAEADQLYTSGRWRKFRAWMLSREPLCRPSVAEGRTTLATQLDHIVPLREKPEDAFKEEGVQPICTACHALKSQAERRARRQG